jgi:hypothetical protein
MVRQAKEQGRKRKPQAIQEWIADAYGVPRDYVSRGDVSDILSTLKKPGKKARKAAAATTAGEGSPSPEQGGALSMEDVRLIKATKELIGRIGLQRFHEVLDLLA